MEVDPTNVWSRYHQLHRFILDQPVKALIMVVGLTGEDFETFQKVIGAGLREFVVKESAQPNYASP
jgi:hypothetical protein